MSEFKFNYGDKVMLLDGSGDDDFGGSWVDGMDKYVGDVVEVVYRVGFKDGNRYRFKDCPYIWDERYLKLVEKAPEGYDPDESEMPDSLIDMLRGISIADDKVGEDILSRISEVTIKFK